MLFNYSRVLGLLVRILRGSSNYWLPLPATNRQMLVAPQAWEGPLHTVTWSGWAWAALFVLHDCCCVWITVSPQSPATWALTVFLPLSRDGPQPRDDSRPERSAAAHSQHADPLWVSANCHPLPEGASLMRAEQCPDLWLKQRVFRSYSCVRLAFQNPDPSSSFLLCWRWVPEPCTCWVTLESSWIDSLKKRINAWNWNFEKEVGYIFK